MSPAGPRVVLVGPMGAGKTTVAGLLAEAWGVPVRDTDADIEAAEGRSISDIFVDDGEDALPRRSRRRRSPTRSPAHDGVLALGGGAVLDERTRDAARRPPVVFLRVGLSDAVKRVGLGSRPAAAARQRPVPDQGAARRADPGLRVGRDPRRRHRRPHARGGRRRRVPAAGGGAR